MSRHDELDQFGYPADSPDPALEAEGWNPNKPYAQRKRETDELYRRAGLPPERTIGDPMPPEVARGSDEAQRRWLDGGKP